MAAARAFTPLLARNHVVSSLKRGRHAIGSFGFDQRRRIVDGFPPTRSGCHRHLSCSAHHVHRQRQWAAPPTPSVLSSCSYHTSLPTRESNDPLTLSDLELRVRDLHRSSEPKRLTAKDVQHQIWPLLVECAAPSSLAVPPGSGVKRNSMALQEELLGRAKLGSRLLELCLKGVEARRVFLWEYLQSQNTESNAADDFSPTAYWNEAPHPPKEMYTVVLSAWKNVIESCSSFSVKSVDAMELMESSAQQASALLFLMEDDRASDEAFINGYNVQVDRGRYTTITSGAAVPDVRNYGEVLATWGQCIDGSALRLPDKPWRGKRPGAAVRDGAFQKRLQLEASAMKSMMKLLESMEECLYETFGSKPEKMRPPPDRVCYNVILAAMARQVNPSLYEMRLVLQRMMERVKYELEHPDDTPDLEGRPDDDQHDERAMAFFPDVYSYNALIEARANRSIMFASDSGKDEPQQFTPRLRHHAAWQQGEQNSAQRRRKFSSSEEEALLAEQILDEMGHLITASVQPNIWSYNAVIKAWIRSDSERGLQRAVMILHSLALNKYKREDERHGDAAEDYEDNSLEEVPSVFGRIVRWGASLLGKETSDGANHPRKSTSTTTKPRSNARAGGHLHQRSPAGAVKHSQPKVRGLDQPEQRNGTQKTQPTMAPVPFGMGSRMALMTSVMQGGGHGESGTKVPLPDSNESQSAQHESSDPIGPLPSIVLNVTPDLKTFVLVINALERQGTAASAKVAEGLLQLLEEHYWELNPDITIYNSALNAWAKAAKATSDADARSSMASAEKADRLLRKMLTRGEPGMFPQPTEYSFLMAINAWANAATISAKNGSRGKAAAEHAEELLELLKRQQLMTTEATLACYGAVIRMWGSLGEAERAQTVLEQMLAVSGNLPQDLIHFNTVLDAWAQALATAKEPEEIASRLSSLRDLLSKMTKDGGTGSCNVNPDTSSFNHVIRACYAPWSSAKTRGDEIIQRQALEVALDVYSKMRAEYDSSHRPDAHTYAHMFKALACLLPKDRNEDSDTPSAKFSHCTAIFRDCCRDGHLAKSSIWIVRKMLASEDEFAELILSQMDCRGGAMSKERLLGVPEDRLFECLPEEWSREGRMQRSLNRHRHK